MGGAPLGCNTTQQDVDSGLNIAIQDMMTKRTPQQRAMEAIQSDDPDHRRKLLTEVLKSSSVRSEWAVKVFATIAKTDPEPQVRCMAIKGLRRSADDRVIEPILMILNQKDYPKVMPAPPEVRWDATEVLSLMSDLGAIPVEHQDWAKRTLIRLATEDTDRNVRIFATHALGNFFGPDVPLVLLQALEDRDFAVRYEAERALRKLTGENHNYDTDEWRSWLSQHRDIASTRPTSQPDEIGAEQAETKNFWEKTREGTRSLFLQWQGERKEGTE